MNPSLRPGAVLGAVVGLVEGRPDVPHAGQRHWEDGGLQGGWRVACPEEPAWRVGWGPGSESLPPELISELVSEEGSGGPMQPGFLVLHIGEYVTPASPRDPSPCAFHPLTPCKGGCGQVPAAGGVCALSMASSG